MRIQLFAVAATVIMTACGGGNASGHDDADGHDHKSGPEEIHLKKEQAETFGVTTDTVRLSDFSETVMVSGEILEAPQSMGVVSAPVSGRVSVSRGIVEGSAVKKGAVVAVISADGMAGGDQNRANRIALEAAEAELERLAPLRESGIVTLGEYNAAKQAYDMALNASRGASGNAVSPISGTIVSIDVSNGMFVEAGEPIATVSNLENLTLKAFLPMRYGDIASRIGKASFRLPYSDRLFSTSALSAPLSQSVRDGYIPVYFNVGNIADIIPGSYADVYLSTGTRRNVIAVPAEALIERQGAMFVYVRLDDDCYERRRVTVGGTDGSRVELTDGVVEGEEVVVSGAEYVRLAETSGAVPQGHSHNH